jgi:hypothetical protein
MTLTEQSADYIKKIGVEQAAAQFGKKPSTIKRWISTNEYPVAVAEAAQIAQSSQQGVNQVGAPVPPVNVPVAVMATAPLVDTSAQDTIDREAEIAAGRDQRDLHAYDPIDLLEEHRVALLGLADRITDIESFLSRITAPAPPPPPAPEPRVVTGQPVDNSNIRPVFATRMQLGGPANPNPIPETKPDTYGANMKTLLTPYNYAQRRR